MNSPALSGPPEDSPQPLVEHLRELRSRLLRCVLVVAALAVALTPFARPLYALLSKPLQELLPAGTSMIAVEVAAPFLVPFKLVLATAVFLAAPYILHQLWSFAAPGMYRHEKRFSALLLFASVALFYLGALFAWFAVLPLVFAFFVSQAPAGVLVMTDIHHYLGFVAKVFFAFGVAFEIPVAVVLCIRAGLVSVTRLRRLRPYVIVSCFVVGMALTPPDVISQIMLAIPAWMLFEAGLLVGGRSRPRGK